MKRLSLCKDEECYGPVIQGEGSLAGTPSFFIRFAGCNLSCCWKNQDGTLTYCDTPHSSVKMEKPVKMTLLDLDSRLNRLETIKCNHVVVTGGEPFLSKSLQELVSYLRTTGYHVTIETNGTIYKHTHANLISLSPKLSSSNHHPQYSLEHQILRINIRALTNFIEYSRSYQFKFVISSKEDEDEIKYLVNEVYKETDGRFHREYKIEDVYNRIYLMPQGITTEELNESAKLAIDMAIRNNWKYSDRLHIRLFGNKRGI